MSNRFSSVKGKCRFSSNHSELSKLKSKLKVMNKVFSLINGHFKKNGHLQLVSLHRTNSIHSLIKNFLKSGHFVNFLTHMLQSLKLCENVFLSKIYVVYQVLDRSVYINLQLTWRKSPVKPDERKSHTSIIANLPSDLFC